MCLRTHEMEYSYFSNDCTPPLYHSHGRAVSPEHKHIPQTHSSPPKAKTKSQDTLLKIDPIAKRNEEKKKCSQNSQSYVFEADKIQLLGTIPKDLLNEFVEFRPFIVWVFNVKGIRGYIFNRSLHAQHRRIYCYDPATKTGLVATPPEIDEIEAGDHVRVRNRNWTIQMNLQLQDCFWKWCIMMRNRIPRFPEDDCIPMLLRYRGSGGLLRRDLSLPLIF
jgi:hypothetical protein